VNKSEYIGYFTPSVARCVATLHGAVRHGTAPPLLR